MITTRRTDETTPPLLQAKATPITASGSQHSLINEHLTLRGDLDADDDILVKGTVYGNIRCHLLIVDSMARVEGVIDAEEVVVRGTTKGTILAKRVRLERTATVESDISHVSFSAEEGARIRGALQFSDTRPTRAAAPTRTQ